MPNSPLTPHIQALREYLLSDLGLNFSENHEKDLVRKLGYAARDFGYHNPADFAEWLLSNRLTEQQRGALASHLTIGETYFLRERKGFEFLEQVYLPGLIRSRQGREQRLRVWCAGCATGEEAYSLAIVLRESIPDIRNWDVSILATDINAVFLEKAKRGVYTKWSFRGCHGKFIDRYFTRTGLSEFALDLEIKSMVRFSQLNLAEDCYPSLNSNTNSIDIIFCRNVLIYFSPAGTQLVTGRLAQSLVKGGILVVSPVEMSLISHPDLGRIVFSGYTIYQKGLRKADTLTPALTGGFPAQASAASIIPDSVKSQPKSDAALYQLNRLTELLPDKPATVSVHQVKEEQRMAQACFDQGNYPKAESILTSLIEQKGITEKVALVLLAKTKANLGQLSEAAKYCEMAIKLDKLDPALYYLMATVAQEQGDDQKAIRLLGQSIYLDTGFVLAHYQLGSLYLRSGNPAAGKKSFRNAIASLSGLKSDDVVPQSDGMTVERFRIILNSI